MGELQIKINSAPVISGTIGLRLKLASNTYQSPSIAPPRPPFHSPLYSPLAKNLGQKM